jgi:4-hydroxy-tetrahydrodipicolinate synthase
MPFEGLCVPLITPFKNGKVDFFALHGVIDYCINGGADCLLCLGTTAESPTLSGSERDAVLSFTVKNCGGLKVIAGAGSNCTETAVERTRRAQDLGADGILSVCPYYNKPPKSGIIEHFSKIAQATTLPVILYDVPSRTGLEIPLDAISTLKKIPNVVGVKCACIDGERTKKIARLCDGSFALYGGCDGLLPLYYSLGCAGMISAAANVMPKTIKRFTVLFKKASPLAQAEFDGARKAIDALYVETNPVAIKWARAKKGLILNELRLPMCPLSHENEHFVEKFEQYYN